MLVDPVDAVRRSAAEQLVMACRIDQDRCPNRQRHHLVGVCSSNVPNLLNQQPRLGGQRGGEGNGKEEGRGEEKERLREEAVVAGGQAKSSVDSGGGSLERGLDICGLWLSLVLVPQMRECLEGSYRSRLLALHMAEAIFRLSLVNPAVLSGVVVPTLIWGLEDRLPNVRLMAARSVDNILTHAAMSEWSHPEGEGGTPGWGWACGWEEVQQRLETLQREDSDRDVQYFAGQALRYKYGWGGIDGVSRGIDGETYSPVNT
ncbi:unnamed protein product [Choristocarpus tenellus]